MMFALRKFFHPGRALLALVAVCAAAPAARADLYLEITDTSGQISPVVIDLGTKGGSGTTSAFASEGFSISYSGSAALSETATGGSASLTLSATVTNIGTTSGGTTTYTAGTYRFELVSSSATGSQSSLPTTSSGYFSPPLVSGGQLLGLYSNLSTTNFVAGGKVTTNADYTSYNGSTAGGIQTVSTTGTGDGAAVTGANSSETGKLDTFTEAAGTSSFDLSSDTVDLQSSGAGKVSFTATSTVIAVPEASGITAALAGLPCFGLLVGLVRRNRAQVAPVLAA
jgi:hypothetical protein